MEYEVEYDVPGRIPECGAIFMSNASTKRECFRRKLFGLPSGQANFVKQIKAGMVLFLFEFEKRELYGVFKACSDGSTNIVAHAFTSSGRQFPAQVRFTPIWYCDPLTEYEFQDAIKENYYSKKKFNFGLSENQVRRLLCLFSSRKLQKPHRAFRRQVSKSVEKERSIASDDDYFLGNRAEEFVEDDSLLPGIEGKHPGKASDDDYFLRNRAEEFVEDGSLVSGIDAKYPGKASIDNGRQLDSSRFIKNDHNGNCCQEYATLAEPPSISFGKGRRGDDDDNIFVQNSKAYCDDLDQEQVIHMNGPGDSSVNSEREAEEHKFSLSKHFMGSNTGPIASPKYCWESLAKVGRATDNCRFSQGDILGDKYTPNQFFGLVTSMGHLENSGIKARASDGHELFADCGVENDYNFANYPDSADPPLNTSCRLRISDKELFFGNDKKEIGHYADDGIGEVRNERSDGNFLRRDRADVPSEIFAKCLDSEGRPNCHDWSLARLSIEHGNTLNSGYPLDKIKRVGEEGTLKKTDGLADAYTMQSSFQHPNFLASTSLSQSRQNIVFFSRNLDTKNSFWEDQPKVCSVLPSSMEQKAFDFSCPTYHDAMVTRTVPHNNGVPGIHCRNLSPFAVDCTSRSIQHMPLHQNSNGNCLAASLIRSWPYWSEVEDLSQCHDVASGSGNEIPLPTSPSYCTRSGFQTNTSLSSAGYHGKMEAKATGQEVHYGSQFPESSSTSPHYSRSDMSDRRKGSPFPEFDKHALTSHGRYEEKIPQYGTSQVDDASFNNTLPYLHSAFPNGKSNDWDSQYYYQNAKGKPTDSQSKRTSVFARLTSEVHAQESSEVSCLAEEESNFDLQYDKCDMGASVDQVMDEIFETMDHRVIKVRKSSLVRKRDMVSDRLKMSSLKMEDDIEHVIDVNWNEIVEETRVVSFKRRSETKKIKDNTKGKTYVDTSEHEREGSVKKSGREVLEGMRNKRRKLVRPSFGKKILQQNDGLSSDGSLTLPVSSSGHDDGTGNLDDLAKSQHNEDSSSPNCISDHLTSLSGGKGTNACIEKSLYCGGKKIEYYDGKEPFNGGSKGPSTSNFQVSCCEGFNAKENTGCCVGLIRSHESDDLSSQDSGLIHMTNPTIC